MKKNLVLALALLFLLTGCLSQFAQVSLGTTGGAATPAVPPTPMIHHSSMGDLESNWQIAEIPVELRGDWRLQSTTGAPLASQSGTDYGTDYTALVFRLTQSPADCRVLLDGQNGRREIGTMPYLYQEGPDIVAIFTGDFHLTYSLKIHRAGGEVVGVFEHAGSGVMYFSGAVRLVQP